VPQRKRIKWEKPKEDKHELVEPSEIGQIQPRVGVTPAQRLQWALDFAKEDLNALSTGDWHNRRRELVAFDGWVIPHEQVKSRRLLKGLPVGIPQPPAELSGQVPLPTPEEVRNIQVDVRRVVETLLTTGEVSMSRIQASFVILRDPKGRWGYCGRMPIPGTWGALTFAELLGGFAPLVRECPEPGCKRWFVASRANKWYCSTKCQSRATTRAYRGTKSDRRSRRDRPSRHGRRRTAENPLAGGLPTRAPQSGVVVP
jgi:CGNR zinc finger protein